LVSPREKEWHVSMRSIDGINVNMIAKSMDGGGHLCASACNTKLSTAKIKENIVKEVNKQLKKYIPTNYNKLFE